MVPASAGRSTPHHEFLLKPGGEAAHAPTLCCLIRDLLSAGDQPESLCPQNSHTEGLASSISASGRQASHEVIKFRVIKVGP